MGHKTLTGSIQGKFWGTTRCFFENSSSEVHYIEANKGGYCSRHYHQNKWNRFIILEGSLKITIYKEGGEDVTILTTVNLTGETSSKESDVINAFITI